jgi:ribosomal 30S subunit maturation factor RimM
MLNFLRFRKTHKLQGDFLIDSEIPETLEYISSGNIIIGEDFELTVERIKITHKGAIVKFTGYNSIDDVVKFRGKFASINYEIFPENHIIHKLHIADGSKIIYRSENYGIVDGVSFMSEIPFLIIKKEDGSEEVIEFNDLNIKIVDSSGKILEMIENFN